MKALELDDTLAEAHAALAYAVFLRLGLAKCRARIQAGNRAKPEQCALP